MAVSEAPSDWQLECENVEQRCGYLLKHELWCDCTFVAGSETTQEVRAHKLVLAMASPVFEAMLYGGLSELNDPIVPIRIPDVEPEAFKTLLQYIYTGDINIDSFDLACDLWIGADKYMLPHLVNKCVNYICTVLVPSNVCRAYEIAQLYDKRMLMDKCIQIISYYTKEVLNNSNFEDVELNTVITVCSLDNLIMDSELDLFHAVERYAEAEQRRQGQSKSPKNAESSSVTSSAAELDVKPQTEELTSEPACDTKHMEVPEGLRLSLRVAIEKIRFLSLSAQEFAAGPARSGLLTRDESHAVLMNIASRDCPVPMPPGFSEHRERRQPRNDSEQFFEAGSLDHTIHVLKFGDPSQVRDAAVAAWTLLFTPPGIQPALDKGILDALVPALTEGNDDCKHNAAEAIRSLCLLGSPSQLSVLAASAALEPYCRLMTSRCSDSCYCVVYGLKDLVQKVKGNTKVALLRKLREIGVRQLLITVVQDEDEDEDNREAAEVFLRTYFRNKK